MTDEMKRNDATRYFVLIMPDGNPASIMGEPFSNEADARKAATDHALKQPGVQFCIFQKIATAHAQLAVEWKGHAA